MTIVAPARRVVRNFGFLVASESAAQMIGFVLTAYLARTLGQTGFGTWVFAISIIAYFGTLVEAGTDTWGIREVSTRPARLRESVDAILFIRLIAATGGALVLLSLAAMVRTPERRLALFFGITSLAAMATQTQWVLRALERMGWVAIGTLVQRLVLLALVLALIGRPADAPFTTLWQGLSEVAAAVLLFAILRAHVGSVRPRAHGSLAMQIVRESWPMGISRAIRGVAFTLNIALLAIYWPGAVVGEFGAASRVVLALMTFGALFGAAMLPSLARACAARDGSANVVLAAALRVLATLFVPAVVGGVVLANPIITLLFTERYAAAIFVFQLLLPLLLVTTLADTLRRVLHCLHRQRLDLWLVTGGSAAAVGLNLVLIPRLGAPGAALALLLAEFVLLALCAAAVHRDRIALPIPSSMLRPTIAASLMAAALFPLRHHSLALSIPAGAAVYALALIAMRDRTLSDLHLLDAPVLSADPVAPEATV
jgi:O-antigen/teichoic acid export membrane protein